MASSRSSHRLARSREAWDVATPPPAPSPGPWSQSRDHGLWGRASAFPSAKWDQGSQGHGKKQGDVYKSSWNLVGLGRFWSECPWCCTFTQHPSLPQSAPSTPKSEAASLLAREWSGVK